MNTRAQLFRRALMLRCPNCAGGGVVRHWLRIVDDCPTCGISLVRGNRVGAYIINIGVAETLTATLIIAVTVSTWPDPPWTFLTWAAPLLAVTSPLVFYPFSRMLFVAADLAVHPGMRRDEDGN
ncbi:MAG TPA: DUF983 domain-containing protein [Gemmatimonadales bacterium]|nr:DUF983 domain-containing protein [Gemmatimonadales bacterium]